MHRCGRRRLGAALAALMSLPLLITRARATATAAASLNIEVAVIANLSVKIDGVASSTGASAAWSAAGQAFLASSATAAVTNDSGAQTERWGLSTLAASIDQGTAGSWSLSTDTTTVGPDQFAAQAVFGSAATPAGGCPSAGSPDWNAAFAPALTAGAPAVYTSARFADTNLNAGGAGSQNPDTASGPHDGRMLAGSRRALCWRVRTPSSTSTGDTQTIMVIVSALLP